MCVHGCIDGIPKTTEGKSFTSAADAASSRFSTSKHIFMVSSYKHSENVCTYAMKLSYVNLDDAAPAIYY